jgi:hypothetical protein
VYRALLSAKRFPPRRNRFARQTPFTVKRKHFIMNLLCIENFFIHKTQQKDAHSSTPLKHGRHFDYWNQPPNTRVRVCYLDCHEAGLCCYLVVHRENLLFPLQLFYSHLWTIYWLSLIASNGRMSVNIKFVKDVKASGLGLIFGTVLTFSLRDRGKPKENLRLAGLLTEIRTVRLRNTSQNRCSLN